MRPTRTTSMNRRERPAVCATRAARQLKAMLGVLAFWGSVQAAPPNAWPHLRGPHFNGHSSSPDLALPWPDKNPTVLWQRPLGQGYSGFVSDGRSAFTQIQDTSGRAVVCLDIRTGRTLWKTLYGPHLGLEDPYPGPFSTPTFADGRLVFAGRYGSVGCLDANTGKRLWRRDLVQAFGAELTAFGYAACPLVLGGRVFLPVGGKNASVVALALESGDTLWTAGNDALSYTSVLPVQVGQETELITFLHEAVTGHAPDSGAELWRDVWPPGDEHAAWPVYEAPLLFCATPDERGARVLDLGTGSSPQPPKSLWRREDLTNDICSSVAVGNHLYGFQNSHPQANENGQTPGAFACVDIRTGVTAWTTEATGNTHVLAADQHLILFNENGTLILAEASPERYVELARADILPGELCWTQPSLCGPYLLVRGQSTTACVLLAREPKNTLAAGGPGRDTHVGIRSRRPGTRSWVPSRVDLFTACLWGVLLTGAAFAAVAATACPLETATWAAAATCSAMILVLLVALRAGGYRETFLWPFPLYMAYLATAAQIRNATPARARGWTFAFVAICLAFCAVARASEVAYGVGFLAGLLPGWPLAALYAAQAHRRRAGISLLIALIAITCCYWSSALLILWRMGG